MNPHGVPVACNHDCGGGCTLLAYTENGRVTKFTRNPHAGRHHMPCIRGFQMHRAQHHKDRLTKPLIRTGPRGSGKFREASWDEALDTVADRLREIREKQGAEAVLHLGGSGAPRESLHNTARLPKRFLSMYGGYTGRRDSYSTAASSSSGVPTLWTTGSAPNSSPTSEKPRQEA